jgi:Zn-dependent metalloprotease
MKNIYLKLSFICCAILTNLIAFGQVKNQFVPNFVNPLQKKANHNTKTILIPNNSKNEDSNQNSKLRIKIENGSFYKNIENKRLLKQDVINELNSMFNLDSRYTFQQISEKVDQLGFTHTNFQQYFKGFPLEGNILMLHSKNGITTSINGQLTELSNIETNKIISVIDAKTIAKNYLKVTELITDYPVETVIINIPNLNGRLTKLAHKVRIDSYTPFAMCYVYVDTQTGNVLNKINIIAHADVTGTAQTLYSANQTITCDSYSGAYRLRETGRKIETYNATSATGLTASGFTNSTDFTNTSTTWAGIPQLESFTISTLAQSWWYTVFADEIPDLYIKIKDGSNQVVFTSNYFNNLNPPLTFNNLNVLLTDAPYTIEVWDYDAVGGDDFGGSYNISTTTGTQSWSFNGNNGEYTISSTGHPALDVHWGMEKTYDFYLSVFNRNSYDGNGSVIKQYLNPPTLQTQNGQSPNNASAYPAPYNLMQYGLGDGQYMNAVVGLDVEGHEYTHMVIANNGNGGLTYQGESGALNESFADIFGVCVEFYTGVNADWLMGEDIMANAPYLRSMLNPNGGDQPDTYNGQLWANPTNLTNDNGGVHINSGVQNFWFYLLCQGGSGTNDLSNAYSVSGIGIAQARQIAYRNLTTFLSPNATHMDAYYGSLQAAQDLFGNPSAQYNAVRQAWYAVGIGNDPNNFCSGTTNLVAPSGTVTDGSGSANYNNNANCKWVIAPAGATQISLNFTAFDTEAGYDTVFVYDGPDESFPILATWWGNTLPTAINTTPGAGAMCIRFSSDVSNVGAGWSANYTSIGVNPSCDGGTILASPTGSFNDGSSGSNYGNNQLCYWFISPPCATSVTLSFSQFNTELDYDGIIVYDDLAGTNLLGVYTGTNIPSTITSSTGKMLVLFVSDYSTTLQGFTANYTSTGAAYCTGTTTLNTTDNGVISDGSGGNNYCNNQDCMWLIQPPQASTVTLNFTAFDLEQASTDGQTIYDAVEIYDGNNTSATLLGTFTGNNIPPAITSTGNSLLVRFYSDIEETKQGWSANYTSTQNSFCSGNTNLTAPSGTFSDGSAANDYANNSDCSWLIQPTNASSITLSFSAFNTELNNDGVIVYDGPTSAFPILGQFSGSNIPPNTTSTGGSMYVEFLSNPTARGQGWIANYTSTITVGLNETFDKSTIEIFPNPTEGLFVIKSNFDGVGTIEIFDMVGKEILKKLQFQKGTNNIDISDLSKGVYLIQISSMGYTFSKKLIVK